MGVMGEVAPAVLPDCPDGVDQPRDQAAHYDHGNCSTPRRRVWTARSLAQRNKDQSDKADDDNCTDLYRGDSSVNLLSGFRVDHAHGAPPRSGQHRYATPVYSTALIESTYRRRAGGFLAAKHFCRIDPQKNTLRSQPRVNPMIKAPRACSCQHEVAGKGLWILLGLRSHHVAQQKVDYSIVSLPITPWTAAGAFSQARKRKSMPLMRQVSRHTTSTQSQTTIPTSSHTLMHRGRTVVAAAHARHLPAPFAQADQTSQRSNSASSLASDL